jgi:hypothetical protein
MRDLSKKKADDLHETEAKVLPAREALSLISTGPLTPEGVEDMAASEPSGGAATAHDAAARLSDTEAAASGGGEDSVTTDDRSIEAGRTDSASSQT